MCVSVTFVCVVLVCGVCVSGVCDVCLCAHLSSFVQHIVEGLPFSMKTCLFIYFQRVLVISRSCPNKSSLYGAEHCSEMIHRSPPLVTEI